MGIERSRVRVNVDCGIVMCNSGRRGIGIEFTLNMADQGGLFILSTGDGRKNEPHYLGAEEWPAFMRMVREADRIYRKAVDERQCTELTPCPPG